MSGAEPDTYMSAKVAACALSRATTDRNAQARGNRELMEAVISDAATPVVVTDGCGGVLVSGQGEDLRLAPVHVGQLPHPLRQWYYLGCEEAEPSHGAAVAASSSHDALPQSARLGEKTGEPSAKSDRGTIHYVGAVYESADSDLGFRFESLRAIGAQLSARETGLATPTVALAAWHRRTRFCSCCGAHTRSVESGWVRQCMSCGELFFPRMDPAVIMAVTDDKDRIVLVHNAAWAAGRFSTVAGFVEAGESAEAAVAREVAEEVGLKVAHVEPVATQPWPFPRSLMLAFRARLVPGDHHPRPDGVEVTQALLLSRQRYADAVASGEIYAPPASSIARMLIEDWLGYSLPEASVVREAKLR